jgi:cytochrome c-type biogenesis protein CcmH
MNMLTKTSVFKSIYLLLILLAASLLVNGAALAQEPDPATITDDQVNTIAKQLYCPVCENIPLDVCGTQACAQWRELIRLKLSQGQSESEIKAYFVAQYGDRVLAAPPARGLNWLLYVIPPLAILGGVYILYRAYKTWKQPAPQVTQPEPVAASSDEYVARIEEELRKR